MKSTFSMSLFKVLFLAIAAIDIQRTSSIGSSFLPQVVLSISLLIVLFFLKPLYFNSNENSVSLLYVKLFLIWNIICIARGLFVAENYWEWKHLLLGSLVLLMPLFVYVFTNKSFVQHILIFWLKFSLPLIVIFVPIVNNPSFYGIYLSPIMFFLLLFPLLPLKWKIIVLALTLFAFIESTGSRSIMIRLSISTLLGMMYYFRVFLEEWIFKTIHIVLLFLPIVLLLLGLLNIFNVFKINQYIKGDYQLMSSETGKAKKTSLKADTRTFIYRENINSALKHNYVIQGRTPANGYDSKYFGNFLKFVLHTGKLQRFTSEVGILNIFTWGGLISVVLYFLVFFQATFLALYRSNNYFIKIIGLFVSFRWAYSFVEEITSFNILYIFLWLFIAMCYSEEFRKMSDMEIALWVKGIFNKKQINTRK